MRQPKKDNARKSDTSPLSELISEMFRSYKLKSKFDQEQLIQAWERLMGKTIAAQTKKIFVKKEVLFIQVNSAPLKQELNLSKSKIMDIITKEFGRSVIKEIVIM